MEFLVPLLIFGAGLIFSGIKSAQETKKQQQRKIDLDKLERPSTRNALPKQPLKSEKKKSSWQTFMDEVKRGIEEYESELDENKKKVQDNVKQLEREARQKEEEKRALERKAHSERAKINEQTSIFKEEVETKNASDKVQREKPVHDVHDVSTSKQVAFSVKDIQFDQKAFVNGVIMNEILGPPQSRKRRR